MYVKLIYVSGGTLGIFYNLYFTLKNMKSLFMLCLFFLHDLFIP